MATYFHGSSEFQPAITATDGNGMQQTLFLINPNYVSFPDTHNPTTTATNMFFFNPASSSHAPPSDSTDFLGLPLPSPTPSTGPDHPNRPSPLLSGVGHNLWASSTVDHQQNNSPPGISGIHPRLLSAAETTADNSCGTHDAITQFGLRRPGMSPRQGLSLSLSSNQEPYRSSNVETVIHGQPEPPQSTSVAAGDIRISGSSPSTVSVVSNGIPGGQSVVMGSKYLRATQELLDEVVKVGKGLKTDLSEGTGKKIKTNKESTGDLTGEGSSAGENEAKPGPELTTAQRQELQMKKAKLVAMLDEVEHRYRQYRHQMQAVVVSFEHAAGLGAATSYTALALQTISKQFRCLKDAISDQIKATSKSLGEEDCLGAKIEGSRLRYVDHQLRQQRTLQQLGMIQPNNAWRPQRGLPERAVCVLRAWLFEHFLHPYPKDSDKLMLAKQTGLTRSQVSNWFINARVRLWKPMVEEMYMEEVKEKRERTDNGSEEDQIINTNKSDQQKESGSSFNAPSKPKSINQDNSTSPIDEFSNSTSTMGVSLLQQTPFNLIGSADLAGAGQRSPKRPRNDVQPVGILPMEMDMKESKTREINMMFGDERLFKDGYSYLNGTVYSSMREIGRFGGDEQQQLPPGFHGNGGVSLTLGLPHGDSLSLPGNHQQNFVVSNQNINELGGASQSGFATYDSIEMQNRKRFAAALLPDFVA